MADFRVTLFFEYFRNGWSETYYRTAADSLTALTESGILVTRRRSMLNRESSVKYVRVSNVDSQRDARFRALQGVTGRGTAGQGRRAFDEVASEEVYDAVNLRLFATDQAWRSLLIRGLPTEAFDEDGRLKPASQFITASDDFLTLLTQSYSIRKFGYSDAVELTAVGIVTRKLATISTGAAIPGVAVGSIVNIRGADGVSNLNGNWRIQPPVGASPYRVYAKQLNQLGSYTGSSGLVRRIIFTYPAITHGVIVGNSSRKTGRPSYLPRGKRSVRRS